MYLGNPLPIFHFIFLFLHSNTLLVAMRYNNFASFFRQRFGGRAQKLSIDAGFSCPNRDGTLSRGGCAFCNNDAFNPSYCVPSKSITQQIDEGILFHDRRYRKASVYLAYFQAYSNTYAPLDVLRQRYSEALFHPRIAGLVVGTRPDCVDEDVLDYLATLATSHFVAVEYGIESCYDATLQRINRGHTFAVTAAAVEATARHGIFCGGHLVLGLPGEHRDEIIAEADIINRLPLNSIKLHQLQLLRGSSLGQQYIDNPAAVLADCPHYELPDYVSLVCDFVERLRPDIIVERFAGEAPPRFQLCPERSWRKPDGRLIRNEEIPVLVEDELQHRNSWQGKYFSLSSH